MGIFDEQPEVQKTTPASSGGIFSTPAPKQSSSPVTSAVGSLFDKIKGFLGGNLQPKTTPSFTAPLVPKTTTAPKTKGIFDEPTTSPEKAFTDLSLNLQAKQKSLFQNKITPEYSAKDFVEALPGATAETAKNIGQYTARAVGTAGISIGDIPFEIAGKKAPFASEIPTTGNKFTNALFGGQPIRDVKSSGENILSQIDAFNNGVNKAIGRTPASPLPKSLAIPFGIVGSLIDLSGISGESGGIKKIFNGEIPEQVLKFWAKTTESPVIEKSLISSGVPEDLARELSSQLADTKTVDDVKNVLVNYTKTPEEAAVAKQITGEVAKPVEPEQLQAIAERVKTMPKPESDISLKTTGTEDALTTEARKYKSAGEFVASQGKPIYHGTTIENTDKINKDGFVVGTSKPKRVRGIWFSDSTEGAKKYAGANGDPAIIEAYADIKNPIDTSSKEFSAILKKDGDLTDNLIKAGYDAVKNDADIAILNTESIKTKPQLTDIYNKAVGETPNLKDQTGEFKDGITPQEAGSKIRELFDDHEVQLITGEDVGSLINRGDISKTLEGFHQPKRVVADLIGLVERNGKVSDAALYHEAFHAYLDNFVAPAEKAGVIKYIMENKLTSTAMKVKYSDKEYPTPEAKAEEWLADDFANFVKTGEADPPLRNFFQRILDRIRKWVRGLGKLDDLYNRVLEKDRSTVNPKAEAKTPSLKVEEEKTPQEILAEAEAKAASTDLDKQVNRIARLKEIAQTSKTHQAFMDTILSDPKLMDIVPKLDNDLRDNGYQNFTDFYAREKGVREPKPLPKVVKTTPVKATVKVEPKKINVPTSKITIPKETQERKEQFQYLVDNLNERLDEHPGKALQKFMSEGVFQDFGNPDLAKTDSERARIEKRNDKIVEAAKAAFQNNPQLSDKFDDPDVIREQIAQYQGLKQDLKDIKEAQGAFNKALQGKILDKKDKIALDTMAKRAAVTEFPLSLSDVTPPKVRGGIQSPRLNFQDWKDIAAPRLSRDTFERNIEKIAPPEDAKKVNDFITKPVLQNELDRVKYSNKLKLENRDLMKKLGITRNSKEDSLIQLYGEKMIDLAQLQQASPTKWQDIKQAAELDRKVYDEMLDKWNAVREKYGYPPIPKRSDYFRHFDEINFFTKNYGFLRSQDQLPTELAGKTEFFKPGKPFSTAELARTGNQTKYSAIGGLDNYIDGVSKQIFHIDSIQRGRALEKYLEEAAKYAANTPEKLKLSNFATNLREYVNNGLAGKTASLDRSLESYVGRPVIRAVQNISNLIGKNIIAGNLSVALTHLVSTPINLATTDKVSFMKGLLDSLMQPFSKNEYNMIDGHESSFLTRRFPVDDILPTNLDKVQNVLSYAFKATDYFKTRLAVAGKYYEGIKNGLTPELAMEKADTYARRLVGDYSIGQRPNVLNAKTTRLFAQFQLGLNDSLSVLMHDIPEEARVMEEQPDGTFKEKYNKKQIIGKLVQWAVFAYLFNVEYKKLRGSGKGLDPINFGLTLLGATPDSIGEGFGTRLGQGLKDLAGELPFTSAVTGSFPLATAIQDIGTFAGDLLTGKVTGKELGQVGSEFLSPIGGGLQVKKTIQGAQSIKQGEADTISQKIKALIFGPTAVTKSSISKSLKTNLQTQKTKLDKYDPATLKKVQDIHDQVAKVGFGTPEGDALVADLNDNEYTIFKALRTVDKAQDAIDLESTVLPIVNQANELGFGSEEADKLLADKFPDTPEGDKEYAAYQTIKTNLYGKNTDASQNTPTSDGSGPIEGNWDKQSFITHIANIAKAVGTDPVTAFKDIFAGNSSWRIVSVDNGNIKVARMPLATSQAIKKKQAADNKKFILDHAVPLEVGGTNGDSNLQILPTGDKDTPGTWAWNTATENVLGKALSDGKITEAQAREYSIRFKATAGEKLSDALQKEFEDKYNSEPLTPEQIKELLKQ